MERARWNTELSHKKLNFVICPTFWGHTNFENSLFFVMINGSGINDNPDFDLVVLFLYSALIRYPVLDKVC